MPTPDISLVFDMTFTGLSDAYNAGLSSIGRKCARASRSAPAPRSTTSAPTSELAFDEMRRRNAIELRSSGSDAPMEGLVNTAYTKLLEMLFKPVEPERVPKGSAAV